MKKLFMIVLGIICCAGCTTVKQIGQFTLLSTRSVNDNIGEYKVLSYYEGESDAEIKKSRAENMEEAVTIMLRNVPGGEFLKNVKVFEIEKGKKKQYFAVVGDVWGKALQNADVNGFKVGDKVQWIGLTGKKVGIITNLTNSEECTVQEEGKETVITLKYSKLTKIK